MLTSVGRTAARRVVASANLNLNLPSVLASRSPLVLRPAAARSFSLSRWNPLAAKTGSATTKKSATKKGSAASAEKKAAPKKKMAAKAKKAAPKKKAKKVLTPEEQYKLKVKELKKTALLKEQPDNLPNNAWALYVAETVPGEISKHSGMSDMLRSIKANYDNLSSSEKQRLDDQATANKQANTNAQKAWIESLPVEDVYQANNARRHLARLLQGKRFPRLADDRLPKAPLSPYAVFVQSRTSNFEGRTTTEAFKEMAQEWRGLRDAEKNRFYENYAEKSDVYSKELQALKDRALQKKRESKAAAKAAAKATS